MNESFAPVTVDYSITTQGLIDEGVYDYINIVIRAGRFPRENRSDRVMVSFELIDFNRVVNTDEALRELDSLGLRSANFEELLTFGKAYPRKQLEFKVVAIGASYQISRSHRFTLCLGADHRHDCWKRTDSGSDYTGYYASRYLNILDFERNWDPNKPNKFRFLAVRK